MKNINEDTTTPAAPDIATTDENLSVDDMFQQALLPSLGRQIFPVIPLHGPTGALFNIRKKSASNELELVRNNVEVENSTSISTGLTKEALQDIKSQYGKEANIIVGKLLRGLANDQENTSTLAFLNAQALDYGNLQLTDSLNAETNLFELTQRVHEIVLQINSINLRSYNAFAVIPYKALGGVFGLNQYVDQNKIDHCGLFVARIGRTNFYMNPDASDATAFVGLNDSLNPNKSSAVFSPYASSVIEADDHETGDPTFFIFNRYAITASPLHVTDNEMLYKFEVLL